MSWDYQKAAPYAPEMKELYLSRKVDWESYDDMITYFTSVGVTGLNNGLSPSDNEELFVTSNVDKIVELLLKGLSKIS